MSLLSEYLKRAKFKFTQVSFHPTVRTSKKEWSIVSKFFKYLCDIKLQFYSKFHFDIFSIIFRNIYKKNLNFWEIFNILYLKDKSFLYKNGLRWYISQDVKNSDIIPEHPVYVGIYIYLSICVRLNFNWKTFLYIIIHI